MIWAVTVANGTQQWHFSSHNLLMEEVLKKTLNEQEVVEIELWKLTSWEKYSEMEIFCGRRMFFLYASTHNRSRPQSLKSNLNKEITGRDKEKQRGVSARWMAFWMLVKSVPGIGWLQLLVQSISWRESCKNCTAQKHNQKIWNHKKCKA